MNSIYMVGRNASRLQYACIWATLHAMYLHPLHKATIYISMLRHGIIIITMHQYQYIISVRIISISFRLTLSINAKSFVSRLNSSRCYKIQDLNRTSHAHLSDAAPCRQGAWQQAGVLHGLRVPAGAGPSGTSADLLVVVWRCGHTQRDGMVIQARLTTVGSNILLDKSVGSAHQGPRA